MKIASRVIYWGLCREAMTFYRDAMHFAIEEVVTYGERDDLGMPVADEHKDLIHRAILAHPSGFRLYLCDSFSLLLSQDTLGAQGCRDGITIEMLGLTEAEITDFHAKMAGNQAIVQVPLGPSGKLKLYSSVMDRFNVNWNFSCED